MTRQRTFSPVMLEFRVTVRCCVMAGLVPATHGFLSWSNQSRGWPAVAGHDTGRQEFV
jgi:hypothetical protein